MPCPENVVDADDILMVETQQDLDLPQCALAVRLVLKRADFLDGYALARHVVQSGAGREGGCGKRHKTGLVLHSLTHNDGIRSWANTKLQKGRCRRHKMHM